jgi:hypothetical protein
MKKNKTAKILFGILTIIALVSLIFTYWGMAFYVAFASVIFGIKLYKLANLNHKILALLFLQIVFLCLAFGLIYAEQFKLHFIDSIVLSFQCLFHVSIINVYDTIEKSVLFKLLATAESFIGYLLIISGISSIIKTQT